MTGYNNIDRRNTMAFILIILIIIGAVVGLGIYFLPTIIALSRNHKNKLAIFLLNFFAGWTFIGWVGALIWSVMH
jgi:hypothetical protein